MTLEGVEKELKQLKVDMELLWEMQWGYEETLLQLYSALCDEFQEAMLELYHHEKDDEAFKEQLSDTHKKYYEKFEELYRSNRQLWEGIKPNKQQSQKHKGIEIEA